MSHLLEDKRKTRGLRMSTLVGEALEADEVFWGDNIWNEEDEDESFDEEEEEVKPDEFDSDFNETEDEDEDHSSNEGSVIKEKKIASSNRYKEPGLASSKASKRKLDDVIDSTGEVSKKTSEVVEKPKRALKPEVTIFDSTRTVRDSTKARTLQNEEKEKCLMAISKLKPKPRPVIKHQFTQKALLEDALKTEKANKTWLESQKLAENDRLSNEIHMKKQSDKMKRYFSKKGSYNTITFTEDDMIPSCLMNKSKPVIPNKVCVITGEVAKYRDPKTGYPYANLYAYHELKRRYHK